MVCTLPFQSALCGLSVFDCSRWGGSLFIFSVCHKIFSLRLWSRQCRSAAFSSADRFTSENEPSVSGTCFQTERCLSAAVEQLTETSCWRGCVLAAGSRNASVTTVFLTCRITARKKLVFPLLYSAALNFKKYLLLDLKLGHRIQKRTNKSQNPSPTYLTLTRI